jgi:hypothetical protein
MTRPTADECRWLRIFRVAIDRPSRLTANFLLRVILICRPLVRIETFKCG